MIKRILISLVTTFFVILALFLSIWTNLSSERLVKWAEYQINTRLNVNYTCLIESIDTHFWGVQIDQLSLVSDRDAITALELSHLQLHFNLISILLHQTLPFNLEAYGSPFEGGITFFPELSVSFEVTELRPNQIPFIRRTNLLRSDTSLNLKGHISPQAPLNGLIEAEVSQASISGDPGDTKLPLPLPDTTISGISVRLSLKNDEGSLSISTLGDIQATINGTFRPRWDNPSLSQFNLKVVAEPKQSYLEKLGLVENILRSYTNKDGKISINASGSLYSVKIDRI